MRGRKTGPALVALAVAAALVIGGCGGSGDRSTGESKPASAASSSGQGAEGAAMKHEGSTKGGATMKHESGAAMHDDKGAMHEGGAAHEKMNDHGGSMHEG